MAKDEVPSAPELDSSEAGDNASTETKTSEEKNDDNSPKTVGEAVDSTEPSGVTPSKEEQLLQSASDSVEDEDTTSARRKTRGSKTGKGKGLKKVLLIIGVLLLIGAVAYFVLRGKPADTKPTTTLSTGQNSASTVAKKSYAPDTIAYAYKENATEPFTVYWRPAGGGERKQAIKLSRDEYVLRTHAQGSIVAMSTTGGLYISTDAGKSYDQVVSVSGQEQITGVRIADSGTRILYAVTSDLKSSKVSSVDLKGKDAKDVATIDAAGVLIYGWNDGKSQFFYSKGCVNCDGSPSSYELYDTKTNKSTPLTIKTASGNYIMNVAISDDFSTIAVVNGAPDTSADAALGGGAAPYTVSKYTVATSKLSTVATIGTAGEKNANGTTKYRTVVTGFLAGTNTLYYADDTALYSTLSGDPEELFKFTKPVRQIDYASITDKQVIYANADQSSNDFNYANYSLKIGAPTTIFDGDANTVVIGVTTK